MPAFQGNRVYAPSIPASLLLIFVISRLLTLQCDTCNGPCTRTLPLSGVLPGTVLAMFQHLPSQIKNFFKALAFQEEQKKRLLEHKEEICRKLELECEELEQENRGLDQDLENAALKLALLDQEEAALKVREFIIGKRCKISVFSYSLG